MKYKLWGISACVVVICLCLVIPAMIRDKSENRYHQHLEALSKEPCSHGDEIFCTHLPLVLIDTGGVEIPGRSIRKTEDGQTVYTTAEDGSTEIPGYITIIDDETKNNHVDDTPSVSSNMMIHVRGRSSRHFDKPNYGVTLIDENGKNNPQSVMGMDAHHEWVLHGPFLDKTLIRNYMWYNIAGEIMDYAPNVRFCEVMVNGEYQGVYLMTEKITAGKDGARLNLEVNRKDNTFTGYLLRVDQGSKNEMKNINNFSTYSMRLAAEQIFNIEYPGMANLTPELKEAITQDVSAFEKALYSYDYDNKKYGYYKRIDVESFVDYFLINELTCNVDAGALSTYVYKDIDGLFRMCVWDFNNSCDMYQEGDVHTRSFFLHNTFWYYMLTKDEDFTEQIIKRYRKLQNTVFSEEFLYAYIDDVVEYLGDAVDRNFEKWGYTFDEEFRLLNAEDREIHSYDEAIEQLKRFLHIRISWLDSNIETLRQYSVESKVKKYNETVN